MTSTLLQEFLAFARGKNPYIVRHDTDNRNFIPEKDGYQDPIEHRLYDPIDVTYLEKMKKAFPQLPDTLWDLYQLSNGATFFANARLPKTEIGGFFFLPMEYWQGEEQEGLLSWVSMDDEDYEPYYDEETGALELYGIPPWFDDVLVLGGFEASPERFYLPTSGEFAGKIFMFEHDEHSNHCIADSFDEFLSCFVHHPADLICLCGGNFYYDMVGYGDDANYIPLSKRYYDRVVY